MRGDYGADATDGEREGDLDHLADYPDDQEGHKHDAKGPPPAAGSQGPGTPHGFDDAKLFDGYRGRSQQEPDVQPRNHRHGSEPDRKNDQDPGRASYGQNCHRQYEQDDDWNERHQEHEQG